MTVLLRCPTCGTTQMTPGPCEACHAGEVRYFCTNHKPGFWLDTPRCADCGARFGDFPRPRAPTSALPPRTRSSPPAHRRTAIPSTRPHRPAPEPLLEASPDVWTRRDGMTSPSPERAPGALPTPLWMALLRNFILARRRSAIGLPGERPRVARGAGGCLLRLVFVLIFLFLATLAAVFMFGWSMLQGY
jgi:hypothetical protein